MFHENESFFNDNLNNLLLKNDISIEILVNFAVLALIHLTNDSSKTRRLKVENFA